MFSLVFGLIAIGSLVLVHELGHFLVARFFGIGAPVFSVGMGPRLFGFQWGDTDVRVCALPIGGYVQLAGADPFGEEDAESDRVDSLDFSKRPVWQKLLVMGAGPGVNLALPVVLFAVLIMAGRPETSTEVGEVLPESPAAQAGLRTGDRIVSVAGIPTVLWRDLESALSRVPSAQAPWTIEVDRARVDLPLQVPPDALEARSTDGGGLDLWSFGALPYRWSARIGVSDPASPAWQAGLRTGDRVVEVDGTPVDSWGAVQAVLANTDRPVVTVEREEGDSVAQRTFTLPPRDPDGPTGSSRRLDGPWGMAPIAPFISEVSEDMPAEEAGLRSGDRLLALNGEPVWSFSYFNDVVTRAHADRSDPVPLEVEIERAGENQTLTIVPRMVVIPGEPYRRPVIGIRSYSGVALGLDPARKPTGPLVALPLALEETGHLMHATLSLLGNLFIGEARVADSLGGPVAIVQVAGESAEQGVFVFVSMLGMLSISLGLINLLPVPVLDGGQILFYLIEGIRGRPLSIELREKVQIVSIMLLVLTFLYVTANDISRWIGAS